MADQVVLMSDGRIEQDGAPAELYARPAIDLRRALHRHAADERARALDAAPATACAGMRTRRRPRAPRRSPRRAAGDGRVSATDGRARDGRSGRISRAPTRWSTTRGRRRAARRARLRPRSRRSVGERVRLAWDAAPRTGSTCRRSVASTDQDEPRRTKEEHHEPTGSSCRHRAPLAGTAAIARPAIAQARPRSRSSTRSPSAARSPRSSTPSRPTSRRRTRRSRSSRSTPAPTRRRSSRRSPRTRAARRR